MVRGPGPKMKGPKGHAAVFNLELEVVRRSDLGGGGEDKLEQRVSTMIDMEGREIGRAHV